MQVPALQKETVGHLSRLASRGHKLRLNSLKNGDEAEVLNFLAARPIHTVFMASLIRDNGLESAFNRGTFYACRDGEGRLEGVALIGHATFVETTTESALAAFARLAQDCPLAHMILGEHDKVEQFWNYFSENGQTPRRVCREVLFVQQWPPEPLEEVPGLRLATASDLDVLLPVNAEMVIEESGVNPLETDPVGFRQRALRRIEQGRVWVWVERGQLLFNVDVISDTPDVIYLEGVYVSPEYRGKGYGLRCLSELSHTLLERAKYLCLFANEQNSRAQAFYRRAGYEPHGYYDSIFLHRKN